MHVFVIILALRNYRVLVRVFVCVCVRVCLYVCVCVFLCDNSKRNRSDRYENSSDEFDIELPQIRVKVPVGLQNISPFYQKKTQYCQVL